MVGKPMGGRGQGDGCMGMGRAPGTEGEGVCEGKTRGGFLGLPPVARDEDREHLPVEGVRRSCGPGWVTEGRLVGACPGPTLTYSFHPRYQMSPGQRSS